jgi:hypothetical protein
MATRSFSLIPKTNTDSPSNPDTSPGNNKYWKGDEITNDTSSFGHTELDRGHWDGDKFISHGKVQKQFKKLGPHSSKPPEPKEPPSNPDTASSVTGKKSMSHIKKNLLRPALTSQYGVTIGVPEALRKFLPPAGGDQEKLNLSCSEAVLPGSNLATMQINNNFTGVTERHAYRRVFDDRVNFTFYVNADNYLPIRFFEAWKSYIMNEDVISENHTPKDKNYTYRVRYPDEPESGYTATGLTITKFERDYPRSNMLTYEFIKSYPISVSSMPVSYDTSGLLKCTVSMTYLRYVVAQTEQFSTEGKPEKPTSSETPNSTTPKPVKYDGEAEWTPSPFKESFSGHDYKHGDKTKSPFNKPSTGDPEGWSSTPWK